MLSDAPEDVAPDVIEHFGPAEAFDRLCSTPWESTLEDGTVGALSGEYLGAYEGLPIGTIQAMNIIPDHPFRLTTIRLAFARGNGNVRIRLAHSFGGSQPDLDPAGDLLPPQEFEVQETSADSWIDLDVSEHEVFLEPAKHYAIVYEQIEVQPLLALEDVPEAESSRAIMLVPGEPVPYGSEGNFRMELGGQTFCRWDEPSHFFGESFEQPFTETIAQYGAFTDLDGDGNLDIVLNQSGPTAFFGDGNGFSVPVFNPFPDTPLYAANIAHPRYQPSSDISMLLISQGPPDFDFTEERAARGLSYDEGDVNAAFADFDNDMHLDLAVASLYGGHYARLYRSDGTGHFTDVNYEANVAVEDAVTVAWADVDKDGDLDLLVVERSGADRAHLFINRVGQAKAWIQLDLRGTTTNRGGVGARVTLRAGGVTQIREVRAGGGHNVQSDRIVHFGLGDNSAIDEVTVRWVGGAKETITGLEPRRRYRVEEGKGIGQVLQTSGQTFLRSTTPPRSGCSVQVCMEDGAEAAGRAAEKRQSHRGMMMTPGSSGGELSREGRSSTGNSSCGCTRSSRWGRSR